MVRFEHGTLITDELFDSVALAKTFAEAYLVSAGYSAWDADQITSRASYDRGWWSESYHGFAHDCSAHSPEEGSTVTCFSDTIQVTTIGGLPG